MVYVYGLYIYVWYVYGIYIPYTLTLYICTEGILYTQFRFNY